MGCTNKFLLTRYGFGRARALRMRCQPAGGEEEIRAQVIQLTLANAMPGHSWHFMDIHSSAIT